MTLAQRVFREKRRLIYPLIIALVVNLAIYAAVVYPLSRKVASAATSAETTSRQLVAARQDFEAAGATVAGKAAADAELSKFYSAVLPRDQSAARRIGYLELQQIARKSDVVLEQAAYESSQAKASALGKLTTTARLSGPYRQIRQFIYALESAPSFLVLENVAVSQGDEDSAALNVTVKVATYYRIRERGV